MSLATILAVLAVWCAASALTAAVWAALRGWQKRQTHPDLHPPPAAAPVETAG